MDEERLSSDRFQIISRLGEGAFGVVYEARDRARGERVAIKALHRLGPDALLRFKQEFRTLRNLRHPNLVRLEELIEQRGRWYITMELVRGSDVLSYVRRGAQRRRSDRESLPGGASVPFDEERLRLCLIQLAQGLEALHQAHKIHRDIKPANVRVTHDGRVVLLDFGLVFDQQEDSSTAPSMVGTAAYMSPEQAASSGVTPASDWYSVGVLLFEMLTGQRPFTGSPLQVMLDKQRRTPSPPSLLSRDVPKDLDELCLQLLAPQPSDRPTGAALLARLGAQSRMLKTYSRVPFVGRAPELERLLSAAEGLSRSEFGSAYVCGPSGSGKTRMIGEFVMRLRTQRSETLVLRGRCHESESVPYKAFDGIIDGLSRILRQMPVEETRRIVPEGAAALGEVFPVLSRIEAVAGSGKRPELAPDPWALRNQVFNVIRELFLRLGRSHHVVLVIDDLHWADAESLHLLERLLLGPERPCMLVVATGRVPERCPESVRRVVQHVLCSKPEQYLELAGLPMEEGKELAAELLIRELDTGDLDAALMARLSEGLVTEAGGHPFLIELLVKHGDKDSLLSGHAPKLEDTLRASIAALPGAERTVLELLALSAGPLRQRVLAEALSVSASQIAEHAARLVRAGLVVEDGAGEEIALSVVQERIQAVALSPLDAEARVDRHRALSRALLQTGGHDPEAIALHLSAAGDRTTAAHYALLAASSAFDALAFDRAARLYKHALELSADDPDLRRRRRLFARLGDSLVGAGRSAEASDAYIAAVNAAKDVEGDELRTRAAQQMLQAGRMREGLDALQGLLRSRNQRFASTSAGSVASFLYSRARLKLRGIDFEERGATWISPERLSEVDLLWSVSCSLVMVDMTRGADLQTRHLLAALDAGEPYRVARALAIEGWFEQSMLPLPTARTAQIFSQARLLAERCVQPHAQAVVSLGEGAAANSVCRFEEAFRKCEESERILRERCRAVTWELDTAQFISGLSLLFMGRFDEVCRRAPFQLREAKERGDRYAESLTRLTSSFWPALFQGEFQSVVDDLDAAVRSWDAVGFTTQSFMKFVSLANVYLYAAPDRAHAVLSQEFKRLDTNTISRVPMLRVLATFYLAQSELAAAAHGQGDVKRLRAQAARRADKLAREAFPAAAPYAAHLRGCLAACAGDTALAISELHEAAAGFERLDMRVYAACATYREGALLGGQQGRAQCEQSIARLKECASLPPPERLLAAVAPGYRE